MIMFIINATDPLLSGEDIVTNTSNFLPSLDASNKVCKTTRDLEWVKIFYKHFKYNLTLSYPHNQLTDTDPVLINFVANLTILPRVSYSLVRNNSPLSKILSLHSLKL